MYGAHGSRGDIRRPLIYFQEGLQGSKNPTVLGPVLPGGHYLSKGSLGSVNPVNFYTTFHLLKAIRRWDSRCKLGVVLACEMWYSILPFRVKAKGSQSSVQQQEKWPTGHGRSVLIDLGGACWTRVQHHSMHACKCMDCRTLTMPQHSIHGMPSCGCCACGRI